MVVKLKTTENQHFPDQRNWIECYKSAFPTTIGSKMLQDVNEQLKILTTRYLKLTTFIIKTTFWRKINQ